MSVKEKEQNNPIPRWTRAVGRKISNMYNMAAATHKQKNRVGVACWPKRYTISANLSRSVVYEATYKILTIDGNKKQLKSDNNNWQEKLPQKSDKGQYNPTEEEHKWAQWWKNSYLWLDMTNILQLNISCWNRQSETILIKDCNNIIPERRGTWLHDDKMVVVAVEHCVRCRLLALLEQARPAQQAGKYDGTVISKRSRIHCQWIGRRHQK